LKSRSAALIVAVALAVAAAIQTAPAVIADGDGTTAQRELRIERTLACPQCTDLPLDICTQDICNDMRAIVHQKVLAGESDAAIREYFVDRYGSRVLLEPPKTSLNLLAWLLPFVALLVGAVFTLAFIRKARRRPEYRLASIGESRTMLQYRSRIERDVEAIE
jgi:cytochrome c-type biogenesis protein CcmH